MGKRKSPVFDELEHPELRKRLVRIAGRVLRCEQDAEDAAHDAVVQALVAAERFRNDAQVSTWIHRIAVNASLMALRKNQRANRHLGALGAAGVAGLPVDWALGGHGSSVESNAVEAESHQQVREAVELLPADYKIVIERCVYGEATAEEAARLLDLTPSAVRTRVGRARKRLRDLLSPDMLEAA